jgi:hypothetical protein
MIREVFGEPISIYTDAQALRDGLLVNVAGLPIKTIHGYPVNRVTRAVWEAYTQPIGRSRVTGVVTNVTGLIDALNAAIGPVSEAYGIPVLPWSGVS